MRYFIFLLLFFGCATQKPVSEIETVSINANDDGKLTINEINPNALELDNLKQDEADSKVEEKKPTISLSVYSSLYSSLALVTLFKKLEKESIEINVINANGFAVVVSALYAKEKNSNTLEWKLFALLKELKGLRPYNKEWIDAIDEFLTKEFNRVNLEDLQVELQIPGIRNDEVVMLKKGNLVKLILEHLNLNDNANYFKKPGLYKRNLVETKIDINFNIVFMPEQIKFKLIDGYSWGIFTNYFGFLMKNFENIDKIGTTKDFYIDELLPLSDINNAYSEHINLQIEKILAEIKNWKEEITTSSN